MLLRAVVVDNISFVERWRLHLKKTERSRKQDSHFDGPRWGLGSLDILFLIMYEPTYLYSGGINGVKLSTVGLLLILTELTEVKKKP